MFKNVRPACRNRFAARSVLLVRERERREERQVCEPEGGKMARTPLAAFFNIPTRELLFSYTPPGTIKEHQIVFSMQNFMESLT